MKIRYQVFHTCASSRADADLEAQSMEVCKKAIGMLKRINERTTDMSIAE